MNFCWNASDRGVGGKELDEEQISEGFLEEMIPGLTLKA